MTKHFVLLIWIVVQGLATRAQSGCTDPNAQNYNASATINDGSCTYAPTTVGLNTIGTLPSPALDESSGLVYTKGELWTHNDGGNLPAIYRINETNGAILQTVNITNATNADWEDITADENYFYIGDFGNNTTGIRANLRVYRISKSAITSASVINLTADTISFSYSDQVIGASPGNNNTAFDCEAFFVKDNVLHLFTKDWVNNHTRHYQLPASPGTHVISSSEPFLDVAGLITSADISSTNQVTLVGYADGGNEVFMYLLYDYSGTNYFSGNKRRLGLGNVINLGNNANSRGQVEAVTFTSGGNGFISSERINQSPFSVPARLYSFSVASLLTLPVDLLSFTAEYNNPGVDLHWQTASESKSDHFAIEYSVDGTSFRSIGELPAAGQSNSLKDYRYTHHSPVQGNNYYRLKQVDADGAEKSYSIKTVKIAAAESRLIAYVSPAGTNILFVDLGITNVKNIHFRIIGINGVVFRQGRFNARISSVAISSLSKGQYILALDNGKSAIFQKR